MMLAAVRPRIAGAIALLAVSAVLTACAAGGGSENQQSSSPLVDTGQSSQSATPGADTGTSPTRDAATVAPSETAVPGTGANVRISPQEVTQDNLTITMSVGTAVRMVAASPPSAGPTPQGQQGQGGGAQTMVVVGGQTQGISKNLDASQGPPPDPKEATGDYIRHVAVVVKDKSTEQVVPYLSVSTDLLRDGRPVQYDQPLLAMVPTGGSADQLHYGNNVAFPGKGRYQLFVRIGASPALGNSAPPAAQFEVTIE